ncbi:replication factor C subunit 4 [Eurytemora carolleeae]|uniref:replication factor C subunit 4 n=1 Tax=Eurytemora carolleeae TaxID=1294199 RepID=UPI000C765A94|nr:replication factor C subunit 4 [Eurytemora carolleeae]|eukprot:XP_023323635.1 replication factor C subunit 4-like [Eurytemora affinis]
MQAFLKGGSSGIKENAGFSSKQVGGKRRKGPIPWVEKYRPRTVEDVAYQDEVVAVLKKSLEGADLPNLLFYGPPGTGKTSTILAAARDLFGDIYRDRILELNASDERGIQVVREKVKNFAQLTASGTRPDGKPCPPFKIIILDEADSMTKDAQSALRRTMEKEGRSTKFCLICNYVSRIIEPLTSRCAKFRFKPLATEILLTRLRMIVEAEKVNISQDGLDAIILTSEGDLRKAITTLQSCSRLKGEKEICQEDVYEISGVIPESVIEGLLDVCQLNSYERLQAHIDDFMCEGFSATQLINQLHDKLISNPALTDNQKSEIGEKLSVSEHCLLEGADEYLQIMAVSTSIMKTLASTA